MPANTSPIFSLTPVISSAQLPSGVTANTRTDGVGTIGTDLILAFTAGASGAYLSRIRFQATASAVNTNTTAVVFHIYVSSQTSGATTAANTFLYGECSAGIISADSNTTPAIPFDYPLNFALPANYTILIGVHAAPAANTAWQGIVIGGSY